MGGSFIIPFPIFLGVGEGMKVVVGTTVCTGKPFPLPLFLLFEDVDGINDIDGPVVDSDDEPFPIIPFRDCLSRK
jgi:hypothetical protein